MTKKIAIVGEVCIDQYVFGHCDRVCPEAAALCFSHSNNEIRYNEGMAGNVFKNLESLDPSLDISLISPKSNIIKKRFVDKKYNSIVFREDINDQSERIDLNEYDFTKYDCIVFSDYCKGFLFEKDIIDICSRKSEQCITFIDTKKRLYNLATHIHYIKINHYELKQNMSDLDYIRQYTNLIVTEGDNGARLYTPQYETHYPTDKVLLRDVCGAGDTFLAALVAKYIEVYNIDEAINFANLCASKVVSQFGVVSI
jgi:bifunctional ADP-heptose synthase (sugar kinase/adenylyltransferase)